MQNEITTQMPNGTHGEPTPANQNVNDIRYVLRTSVGSGGTNGGGGTGSMTDTGKDNTM